MNKFTEKDLSYISDMFSWNETALRVSNHFLEHLEESSEEGASDAKELMEEIVGMHYENLNKCIAILKGCDCENCDCDEEDYDEDEEEETHE